MKKLIFLLFLLLIACAPVATVPPTFTALPPIPTITPSPTATPNPTATPSAPREAEGGVQVFENGEWIELKAPEGIWGPVDGSKVVLVDDGEGNQEAYTQMKLQSGFKDIDGDEFVNVAKYDSETKKWVVVDSTVVRAKALSGEESYDRNYNFTKFSDPEAGVDAFTSRGTVLAMRTVGGENKHAEFLMLYKKHIAWVIPDQVGISRIVDRYYDKRVLDSGNLDVGSLMEIMKLADLSNTSATPPVYTDMKFLQLQPGATLESCTKPLFAGGVDFGIKFADWCKKEIERGINRPRLFRSDLDWIFQGGAVPTAIDENFDTTTLVGLLDTYESISSIDGAHFVLNFTEQYR